MSISVTEDVSAVTDVMVLLSNLGFDAAPRETHLELVIDRFDQWVNPAAHDLYASSSFPCSAGPIW